MPAALRTRTIIVLLGVVALLAAGCAVTNDTSRDRVTHDTSRDRATNDTRRDRASRAVPTDRLADEDLVGQVLMPYVYGSSATRVSTGSAAGNRRIGGVDTPAELVRRYRLGGLILVGFSADDPTGATNPTSNLDSPQQIRDLTAGLQQAAADLPAARGGVPLLLGTDQEYGVVTRVREGITQLPSAMAFGAANRPELTRRAWAAAGGDLAALGINLDFAPDADVLGPGGSAVIGSRSFGSDPQAVSAQVSAAVQGLADAGVAAAPKHFPGHGHTTGDSHDSLPVVDRSAADLAAGDLPPFRAAIAAHTPMIMSGHLDVRAIDPGTPASFSGKVLIDLLRGQLGFTGVVVTDALNMTPAQRWPAGEAAVRAMLAGNDLLLMPPDLSAARDGLLGALHSGRLPRQRLIEAVDRIRALKASLGGRAQPPLSRLDDQRRTQPADEATAAAVTLVRGSCGAPLVTGPVTVTSSGGRDRQREWLTAALHAAGVPVGPGGSTVHLVGYGDGPADLSAAATVTVGMDTPGLLAGAASPTVLATYASTGPAMRALASVLVGRACPTGRAP